MTGYAYSASLWLRTGSGIKTTTNVYDGMNNYYVFKLSEVFALWFTDENHIMMYIY